MSYSEELFETVSTRHGSVTFFANDTGAISQSLRNYGEWAENELSFVLSVVREGDTVIDVGAFIGTHSLAFARHVGTSGHVVSVEPQARSFQLLQRNVAANGLHNVRLENAIASSSAREEVIPSIDIASPASYGSASLRDVTRQTGNDTLAGRDELAVHALAIDDLNVSSCSLIKIDVEGMEEVVLSGVRRTVQRCKPVIYAECNSLEDGLRSVAVLRSFGYRVRAHVVRAFNEDNFRRDPVNIFDGAREVALVAVEDSAHDPFADYALRSCELLIDIETADDLALALLNKPQYEHEVLRKGAASRSGGLMCLEEARLIRQVCDERQRALDDLRSEHESLRTALESLREEHEQAKSVAERRVERLRLESDASLEQLRTESDASLEQLRMESDALRNQVHRMTEAVREMRERADRAEAAVEGMRRSMSWRFTAPLRAISRLIRGKRA
ncbi:FkbM family methyltransferase [Caballeronia sp. S22]|uniref:FkbM family methyltransferase n=1 Tax=Caballeronia sp. S22 TaxID=3137182 RepID=UPI0035309BD4